MNWEACLEWATEVIALDEDAWWAFSQYFLGSQYLGYFMRLVAYVTQNPACKAILGISLVPIIVRYIKDFTKALRV